MNLPLIQIFFSLILLLLWFFLVNLKEKYLEFNLKGWGEMSLGVFLIFLGSLLELGGNSPELQRYLFIGNTSWGELGKISLYVAGIILVSYSPLNWLPSILESRRNFRKENLRSAETGFFSKVLEESASQVESRDKINSILDFTLSYLSKELTADSGTVFLFQNSPQELALTRSQGLLPETLENLKNSKIEFAILSRCIRNKMVVTAGEILNSDHKLAYALREDDLESVICIPILGQDEVLGAAVFFSKNRYHFEHADTSLLLELSASLGKKVQDFRKIENLDRIETELKIAREKEKFHRLIAEDLIKASPDDVLLRIVKAGAEIFHPCSCKIYLRDKDFLRLRSSSDSSTPEEEVCPYINNWLWESLNKGELIFLSPDESKELREKGLSMAVAAPLMKGYKSSGVIVLECTSSREPFSSLEFDFLGTLALEASEALKNLSWNKSLECKDSLIDSILDSVEDRITLYDKELKVIKINKAGLRFLDLTIDEVVGKSCHEIIYAKTLPEACPGYLSLKEKKPIFQQIRLSDNNSNRERALKIWAYPLLDENGEVLMVVEYAKLVEAQESPPTADAGKKEVPREFFNDLNNILAGILGNAELIMFQLKPYKDFATDMVADQIGTIEELVVRGSKLIREVKGEIEELPEKKQVTAERAPIEEEKKKERLNILAIDDQKIIRDLLESILQGLGHDIKVASSGKEGLVLFQQNGFDLVITDLGMPEMSGWEVSQRVKEIRKETPVVMITGWGVSFESEKIKEFGVDYLLPKPFKVEQLSKLIEEIREEKLKNKIEKSE
ncbi:MAG TPA: response regulator [Terriglobales bacterium]|nr:response regulator [Terriglobales bacterium]